MTPADWLTTFKQDKNPSPHTMRAYETALQTFQGFMEIEDISNVTENDIRAYIAKLEAQGNKRVTIVSRLTPLRLYFKMLHDSGTIPATPFARINYVAGKEEENRQRAEAQRKLLTVGQIRTLLDYDWSIIRGPFEFGDGLPEEQRGRLAYRLQVRNRMIVYLLADTGRRVVDLCRVLRDDVDLEGKVILFNHTKSTTGKGVTPISKPTVDLIRQYIDLSKDCGNDRWKQGYLIDIEENTIRLHIAAAMQELGMKKHGLNAHAIDHFFITNAREQGVSIDTLSEMTGKSIKTLLKIYNHPGTARVQEEHRKASVVG